ARLRGQNFDVSDAHPGKACDATFTCHLHGTTVSVVMVANEDESGRVEYQLLSWERRALREKLFRAKSKVEPKSRAQWAALCYSIEGFLQEMPEFESLTWEQGRDYHTL